MCESCSVISSEDRGGICIEGRTSSENIFGQKSTTIDMDELNIVVRSIITVRRVCRNRRHLLNQPTCQCDSKNSNNSCQHSVPDAYMTSKMYVENEVIEKIECIETVEIPVNSPEKSSRRRWTCILVFGLCVTGFLIIVAGVRSSFKKEVNNRKYVIVDTSLGKVKGLVYKKFENKTINAFLGVPFAQPPVGERRFKRPYYLRPWKPHTLSAISHPPGCMQLILANPTNGEYHPVFKHLMRKTQSEDCLYLNIFVPGCVKSADKKPVVIWIHGGAFNLGIVESHDLSVFSATTDVIVVSIAYRLGIFGFLHSTHSHEIPGNMGLWDQVAAIRWVREHIESFGGGKDQITLMGESAGGISVGYHMISPHSRPLFKRAILMSGSPLTMTIVGVDSGPLYVEKVARELNCPLTSRTVTRTRYAHFHDKTYECLRRAEVSKLQAVERKLIKERRIFGFQPTMDDEFFPIHPLEFFKSPEYPFYANHTEIMMGTTGHEGAFFLSGMLPDLFPRQGQLPRNLSYKLVRDRVSRIFPQNNRTVELAEQMASLFNALVEEKAIEDPEVIAMKSSKIVGDQFFTCPNLFMLNAFTNEPLRHVFYYQFNTRPTKTVEYPWSKTARHGEELKFVFGHPFLKPSEFTDEERTYALTVMKSWGNFIKYGYPTDNWKPCEGEDSHYMDFTVDRKMELRKGLPSNTCGEFFETLIEYIREKYRYHDW